MQNIEQYLREKASRSNPENIFHEHALRRALLNSDFFHPNIIVRWKKRLGFEGGISLQLISLSLLAGIFLAFVVQFVALGVQGYILNNPQTPEQLLQRWYESGKLQYAGKKEDGSRVYRVHMEGNTILEIYDRNPISLEFVNAGK